MQPDVYEPSTAHVPSPAPAPSARQRPSSHRLLTDLEGMRWLVYEWTAPPHSPLAGRRFLRFDAASVIRRLTDFPAAWASMSDAELLALM